MNDSPQATGQSLPTAGQTPAPEFQGAAPGTPLKIVAFGACMIIGYPLSPEVSFFNRMVKELAAVRPVDAKMVSLGGFPVERASKHLAAKVLPHHPDYVVVQFGSLDAFAWLGEYLRLRLGWPQKARKSLASPANRPIPPANLARSLRWRAKGLIARCLRVPTNTPRPVYRQSIAAIAAELIAGGAKPIVLTPFLYGDRYSNEFGALFAADVENLGRELGFTVLRSHQVLRPYPVHKVLLGDGFHLSEFGHAVIARELLRIILESEQRRLPGAGGLNPGAGPNAGPGR